MILRFRDDSLLSEAASRLASTGQSFQSLTGDSSLDDLNAKFKVRRFEKLLDGNPEDGLGQGSITVETARALLRETKAARETMLGRLRTEFPRRSGRAPALASVPSLAGLYRVEFEDPEINVPAACAAYAGDPQVLYAQPNHLNQLYFTPDDLYYASAGSWDQPYDDLWGIKKLDPEPAWDLTRGEGAIVAVLDTGIDYNHPDIRDNILRDGSGNVIGYDFADGDADPMDVHGHGTHVAGTIAAAGDNGAGVIGVAPLAKIMPLKIFGVSHTWDTTIAAAIKYAADHGADVLNNSWGPSEAGPSNPLLEEAVARAHAMGCVVVFAAGNDGADISGYSPNNHPAAIAVGATDQNDVPLAFSNHGPGVAVSAPGGGAPDQSGNYQFVNILSLRAAGTDMYQSVGKDLFTLGDAYYRSQGTSMAAPHVSGVAALLAALHPDWSNDRIAGQIIGSADPVAADNMGSGRVNAYRALTAEPRVYLKYLDCLIDDNKPGNTINGQPEAGDTLALICTLKNVWLGVGDVRARLVSLNPRVTVQDAAAAYGAMGLGEMKDNAVDPFIVVVSPEALLGEQCRFELEITADGHVFRASYEFRLDLPAKPGWPVSLEFNTWVGDQDVLLTDLDGDGAEEILFAGQQKLGVFRGDGTPHAPWPQAVSVDPQSRITQMAAGDIDGDSDLELVVLIYGSKWQWDGSSIAAFHQESGLPVAGWPVSLMTVLGTMYAERLVLADVDGDGAKDVVVCGYDYLRSWVGDNPLWWVGVLRGDGTVLPGWPARLTDDWTTTRRFEGMGLAVGNLDGPWEPEIVVSARMMIDVATGSVPRISPLWVLRSNGETAAGWPRTMTGSLAEPVLANLDGGRGLEIVVGEELSAGSRTHAYKLDGSELPGWPVAGSFGATAAGDLEGDGTAEVVVNERDNKLISVIDAAGSVRSYPMRDGYPLHTPTIADVDGDDAQEIILSICIPSIWSDRGCAGYRLAVLRTDGTMAGFPSDNIIYRPSQPAVGDIDGDGGTDFVLFLPGIMRSLAFTNHRPFTSPPEWPQYRRNATRNGANHSGSPPAPLPIVKDDGVFTRSADTLSSRWYFYRKGVEADRFAYAIGSAPGLSDITPWKFTGLRPSAVRGGLALAHGQTYYFRVRALAAGLPPFEGRSDGITADLRAPALDNRTPFGCAVGKEPVFRARVTDGVSGVRNVSLRLREKGQSRFGAPRAMTYDALAGDYVLRLPTQAQPRYLEYTFTARDRAGNVRRSPISTLRIKAQ